jgi:hypothetical protein
MACFGGTFFKYCFLEFQILLRFYSTFSNFGSGFLNYQNIISKNKFSRYSQFFKKSHTLTAYRTISCIIHCLAIMQLGGRFQCPFLFKSLTLAWVRDLSR